MARAARIASPASSERKVESFMTGHPIIGSGEDQMAVGFILISTAPAKEHEVYNELLKVKEVVELHPLFGEYDLIAKIEAEDFNLLGQVVVDKVRSIPGVIDTKTLTGIKF
jgi:DNA-binding Lrp family transcriptional regulator